MASLADIYKSEKKQGGGLVSALGKSMKESFDPRNLLDQKGLMVSMFPSLKGYKAIPKKGKEDSSGTSPQKASFDELLSGLGTKTTFDRLYKAQVMSMKYTSVLPEISSDLKKINKLLLGMIQNQTGEKSFLDNILDSLGLGDSIGGKKRKPGARERLKRIKAIRAERLAAQAAAAKVTPTPTPEVPKVAPKPTPEVPAAKTNSIQQRQKAPNGTKWDEKAKRWRGADGKFVKAPVAKETLKDIIKTRVAKAAGKLIPGLGIAFGLWEVFERVSKGDYTGAGIAAGSALASSFPGIGTGIGIAGFAANLARDVYEEAYGVFPEQDEEGDVQEKYEELVNMIIYELTKKDIKPISPENQAKLEPLLNQYKDATTKFQRHRIATDLRNLGASMGINADTIDYELEKIRQGKAGEIQSAESKLLEELINEQSSRLRPGEVEGQVRTGNVTPDNSAGGGRGSVNPPTVNPESNTDFPLNPLNEENGSSVSLEPPSNNVPTPPAAQSSLDTSDIGKSGSRISAASSSVAEAQLDDITTPRVISNPANSTMYTPPSEEIDMTKLPIASVYNEDFMNDFFGSRQQSFATG